ncbi:methyltransferase [Aquimarina sp. ERC-38]|uniref:methyltransferase n=1 Tax=Aquimarina sp. ERC-38 TaxID=2949996 RepID=UPI002246AFA6|nr:methyltransferase [Aquimarina sp. ERC-38]UZO82450.1 methyltransferase [Aquimarina sp. ERC-38]
MYENSFPHKRYQKTISFLKKHVQPPEDLLDLGVRNPLVPLLEKEGYTVRNTTGEDLDLDLNTILNDTSKVLTAFEIFEHMLSPLPLLMQTKATQLVASVPLKLWFSPAYQSKTDLWDRHYHEFEDWQFDWLLQKAGWTIKDRLQWVHPVNKIGIRPLLRKITPRYYMVYAERL